MPAVLYELGVVVTVGLSFAPQAVMSAQRVREARRLRGRPHSGLRGLRGLAMPVLEGALEHSLQLAASMDSRGYGRRGDAPARRRRVAQVAMLAGAMAVCLGAYGLLDNSVPSALGLPALAIGCALLVGSLALGGVASSRTRYRPDPWRVPEWTTVAAGLLTLTGLVLATKAGIEGLHPPTSPLSFPTLPLFPVLAILCATIPAFTTPEPL
jgi:energy-coupling factor transport system permease protein